MNKTLFNYPLKTSGLLSFCLIIVIFTFYSCEKKEPIVINEIMASNHSSIMSQDGELYDWLELKNTSSETVTLSNVTLVLEKSTGVQAGDGEEIKEKTWDIPTLEMKAGECVVIFASKKDKNDPKGELHASFKLPSTGGKLKLMNGSVIMCEISFPELEDDQCYRRLDDGSYELSYEATPGEDNTAEGYEKSCSKIEKQRTGSLKIWELHSKGHKTGEAWVEIKNISSSPVALQDYCLTTSKKDMSQWTFPEVELQPGALYVVDSQKDGFKIGKNKSIMLTKDGKFVDGLCANAAPHGTTSGRVEGKAGTFYFKSPTRGQENTTTHSRTPSQEADDEDSDE